MQNELDILFLNLMFSVVFKLDILFELDISDLKLRYAFELDIYA